MMRKTSDYSIGEFLIEGDYDYGRIISIAEHTHRRKLTFLLVWHRENGFTIMQSATDAICSPWLARHVPKDIMRRFLFDAFVGVELPDVPVPGTIREPVVSVPEYEEKAVIKPVTESVDRKARTADVPVVNATVELPVDDVQGVGEVIEDTGKTYPAFDFP